MPPKVEELVDETLESGDTASAEKLYRLYTEAFDNYAGGYLGLGLAALRKGELTEAEAQFKKAAGSGRMLFPKGIAKSRFWNAVRTSPPICIAVAST